jgi:hypothetical protein
MCEGISLLNALDAVNPLQSATITILFLSFLICSLVEEVESCNWFVISTNQICIY